MRLICPHCNSILARIEEGTEVHGTCKCLNCQTSFGFSNIKKRDKIVRFWNKI